MKILQIYDLDPIERIGGIEVAVFDLSRHLAARGHDVTVVSGADDETGECTLDGVRFIRIDRCGIIKATRSSGGLSLSRQMAYLPVVLSKHLGRYDIYHGHLYTCGLAANILARRYGGTAVNTIHGSYYPAWNMLADPVTASFYRSAERIIAPALARLSGIQIHTGRYFALQVQKWGVKAEKTRVIYNGVDLRKFNPDVKPVPYDCSCPVLLTSRRLVKKNGIDRLLRAMPYILARKKCRLIIIGDGPERSDLMEMSHKLGIEENVDFLGSVPHNEMPGYIARSDIAVIPSIIEASSIFMLEAMAMAKPVVATGAWGLSEIINNNNGVLVDAQNMGEKIVGLLEDSQRSKELGANAFSYIVENHDWSKIAGLIESEYIKLKEKR